MYYFNLYKYYVLIVHIIMLYIVIVLLTILVVAVWILRRKIKKQKRELEPTHYAPYDDAHSLSGDSRYSKLCFTFQ